MCHLIYPQFGYSRIRVGEHDGTLCATKIKRSNYVTNCTPTSPPVWDLEYFDLLVFVAQSIRRLYWWPAFCLVMLWVMTRPEEYTLKASIDAIYVLLGMLCGCGTWSRTLQEINTAWGRSQWPHGLSHKPWSFGLGARIPLKAWMSVLVYSSSIACHPHYQCCMV
jgi:hypothetical protein